MRHMTTCLRSGAIVKAILTLFASIHSSQPRAEFFVWQVPDSAVGTSWVWSVGQSEENAFAPLRPLSSRYQGSRVLQFSCKQPGWWSILEVRWTDTSGKYRYSTGGSCGMNSLDAAKKRAIENCHTRADCLEGLQSTSRDLGVAVYSALDDGAQDLVAKPRSGPNGVPLHDIYTPGQKGEHCSGAMNRPNSGTCTSASDWHQISTGRKVDGFVDKLVRKQVP